MNFKFSKNQTVQAAVAALAVGVQLKQGTKGRILTHRVDQGGNVYLVKFKGHADYVQAQEQELAKV